MTKDDLELKDLGQYYGTENHIRVTPFKTLITDGIYYIMNNGYSWFVTDSMAVIEHSVKCKDELFFSIKLKLDGNKGKMIITDGNKKKLHEQDYDYTDAKKELTLFCTNGVMMLSGEY